MRRFPLLFLLITVVFASAELISTGVGVIRGRVVTSREVQIQNLLGEALYNKQFQPEKARLLSLDSSAFGKAVQDSLLEAVIAMEASNFNAIEVRPEEVREAEKRAQSLLRRSSAWKSLQTASGEVESGIKRKLRAKKFVNLRAQSSVLPVTDSEAQRYFNENRLKFGNLPFENFKENIKSHLSRNQVDQRLKDWYEVLLNKYQVKNLIAEI